MCPIWKNMPYEERTGFLYKGGFILPSSTLKEMLWYPRDRFLYLPVQLISLNMSFDILSIFDMLGPQDIYFKEMSTNA